MWIRTQNKKALFKVTEIVACLNEQDGKYELVYDGWLLGAYSTESLAMTILDKIHRKLDNELELNLDVFQMPEDDNGKTK